MPGVSAVPTRVSVSSTSGSRPPPLPVLTADERLRRHCEIRQGKRPVDCSLAVSSSQLCRLLLFLLQPIRPCQVSPLSVRSVPMVTRLEAASNRRRRRVVVPFLCGRAPVRVEGPRFFDEATAGHGGPPFSDEDIAWLKAVEPTRSYYGGPEFAYLHCHAVYWSADRCKRYKLGKGKPPVYNGCCRGGKISLPGFHDWPDPLKELPRFDGGTLSSHFLRLIRHYNSLFCFTSMGSNIDERINVGVAPYVFNMYGVVFHRIGSFLPVDGRDPQFPS